MGSKKSSSTSSTTTTTQDNSAVAGNEAIALAAGANYTNWLQTSDSYAADFSDRSVSIGTDPGLLQWNQQASQLLGALAESQTDAVRFMTDAGAQVLRDMGESATNLYSTAGSNNVESWGDTLRASEAVLSGTADRVGALWSDTLEKSADLIGAVTSQAGMNARSASELAETAITSYQPPENANASAMRWGMVALAGLAAVMVRPSIKSAYAWKT